MVFNGHFQQLWLSYLGVDKYPILMLKHLCAV